MPGSGVLYIALGEKYAAEAARSAATVKAHTPDLSTTIFTDRAVSDPVFDNIVRVPSRAFHMRDKPDYMARTPYERTLFLDTDTFVCDDIGPLFRLLERFDFAAAHGWQRLDRSDAQHLPNVVAETPMPFAQFNSGVILYKESVEMVRVLGECVQLLDRNLEMGNDQTALRQAVYASSLRVATLTPEYNCRAGYAGFVSGEVKILHGRRFDAPRVAALLNRELTPRVYMNFPESFQVWARHDLRGNERSALGKLRARLAVATLGLLRSRR